MTYTNFNYMLSASAATQEARELQRAANTILKLSRVEGEGYEKGE